MAAAGSAGATSVTLSRTVSRILTLLTDFGLADYYVGALKGTILRLAPGTQLVDLSHEVPPGDVEGAADLLAAAAPTFPAGTCHLAVVDPGVGSARRMLVVQGGDHSFVAPDNGLLTPQLAAGGAAWEVTRRDLFLDGGPSRSGGATFHGRDRFAPIAAALLRGDHPNAVGRAIEDPVRLELPPPRRERHEAGWRLTGRIARIDRYGNLITDLPAEWLAGGALREATVGGQRATRLATHYAELADGEPAVIVGSLGTLELSLRGDSLAARLGARRGDRVRVELG